MKYLNLNNFEIRWLFSCLIFFAISCKQNIAPKVYRVDPLSSIKMQANLKAIDSVKKLIESGDIITRTGNDFTSQSLKSLNRRDKTFSHCGIASMENDTLFIYHALGGEWNPDQKIKREPYKSFANSTDNNMLGIFRYTIKDLAKRNILTSAQNFYARGIKFDMDFDLKTDEKMYCAEFIYKVFLEATDSSVKFNHSFIRDFEFIGVDDVITDSLCRQIAILNYNL